MEKIPFEGIKNMRDLGGIRTADGRSIRKKKLLKSGQLFAATQKDIERLVRDYQVEMIVDLRTRAEREACPDPAIKGVSNLWNPLFTEDVEKTGVFASDEKDILEKHLKALFIVSHQSDAMMETALKEVRQMVQTEDFEPEAYMARMYQKLVNNQVVQKQIRQFFRLLGNRRDGAVLWHCGAGKDRSGICMALLLYALGVTKETIIEIYRETAESSSDTVDYLLERLFPASVAGNLEYQAIARRIFGEKTCYIEAFFTAIEKDYVSVDHYLQKAIEVHVDNLVRLKTLYLTAK